MRRVRAVATRTRSFPQRHARRSRESSVLLPSAQVPRARCHNQSPPHFTARCHSMSQPCPGSRDAVSQTVVPRRICGCDSGVGQRSLFQERLQVSLECAPVLPRAKSLIVLGREASVLDDVAARGCLPVEQGVLTYQHVPADSPCPRTSTSSECVARPALKPSSHPVRSMSCSRTPGAPDRRRPGLGGRTH